jgi:hypothetical protein
LRVGRRRVIDDGGGGKFHAHRDIRGAVGVRVCMW